MKKSEIEAHEREHQEYLIKMGVDCTCMAIALQVKCPNEGPCIYKCKERGNCHHVVWFPDSPMMDHCTEEGRAREKLRVAKWRAEYAKEAPWLYERLGERIRREDESILEREKRVHC